MTPNIKKYNYSFLRFLLLIVILSAGLMSCGKDEAPDNIKQIKLYLTDDPIDAEEVNVEIVSVILIGDNPDHKVELNTLASVYNLLDLQGDVDTLLASGNFDLESIKEIRLVLGDDNTIVIDGTTYPLEVPASAKTVGIKIKIDQDLRDKSVLDILIDFDAQKSIREANGKYFLAPVIKYRGDRNVKTVDLSLIENLDSCFSVLFPIIAQSVEDIKVEINSLEELITLYNSDEIYGAIFPFDIVVSNSDTTTVNNHQEGFRYLQQCAGIDPGIDLGVYLEGLLKCFEVAFPISIHAVDGQDYIVNSYNEILTVPNAQKLNFPINIVKNNGAVIPVQNEQQLLGLIASCVAGHEVVIDVLSLLDSVNVCFEIEFPITVKFINGQTKEINNLADLLLMDQTPVGLIFPIKAKIEDGEIVEIQDEEEMKKLIAKCKEGREEEFDTFVGLLERIVNCYDLEFPLTVHGADSLITEVESLEALQELLNNTEIYSFIYPFNILSGDQSKTIHNFSQLIGLLQNCKTDEENLLNSIRSCYSIKYPVEVKVGDEEKTIDSDDALDQILSEYEDITIKFPMIIINTEGKEINVQNRETLRKYADECK